MNTLNGLVVLGAAASMGLATTAQASEQTYRVDATSESTIDINVCSSSVYLQANGDGDTDLDFWLYDNAGNLVHSDTDSTDITFFTISNGSAGSGRCLPYQLKVQNFGDVYNNMTLSLTDQGATSSGQTGIYATKAPATNHVVTQSVRSDAESSQTYTLSLCAPSVYLEVRGDGDTDLDFWVYDESGREVHSDTDSTDITFATLNSGRGYGSCANFQLRIHNYGSVYNQVAITLTEQ
jgi:sulfur transfer protein SufE